MTTAPATASGPTVLDALSLLAEVADELVVRSVRDTHLAVLDRTPAGRIHRGVTTAVYGGLTRSLTAASRAVDRVAEHGPALESDPRGRFLNAAVNGLIGDRLLRERPQLAIPMAVRLDGRDVTDLAASFPDATGQLVVFLHGLCESDASWGPGYPAALAGLGWTPLLLRANTGLPVRENGAALAALLERVVEDWPVPVTRIALVGHSMGGLVIRAASAVVGVGSWPGLVSDVVTLGTPHLGAPIAWGIGHGSRGLAMLRETAAFGRILDWRSRGVHDLVAGLAADVPALPHARYHLVAATLSADERHPVGNLVGDLLVRPHSAYGRDRTRELFPDADVLHVGRTDHFGLLDHPDVRRALEGWLA